MILGRKSSQCQRKRNVKSLRRRIELSEELIEFYDHFFRSSTNYPKFFLQDLAFLYLSIGQIERAEQIFAKAKQLCFNDYQDHLDYDLFHV